MVQEQPGRLTGEAVVVAHVAVDDIRQRGPRQRPDVCLEGRIPGLAPLRCEKDQGALAFARTGEPYFSAAANFVIPAKELPANSGDWNHRFDPAERTAVWRIPASVSS